MLTQCTDLSMKRKQTTDILDQCCEHGGKRWTASGALVGFDSETKTVYQYHGCHWHGCIGKLLLAKMIHKKSI